MSITRSHGRPRDLSAGNALAKQKDRQLKNLVKLTVAFFVMWFFYNVVTHVGQSTELINRAQANQQQDITNPVPKSETTEEFKSRMDRETMPSPTPAANRHKFNEQFTLGDYSYRVTKIVTASRLGNQFVREVAGQDEKFVVVYSQSAMTARKRRPLWLMTFKSSTLKAANSAPIARPRRHC